MNYFAISILIGLAAGTIDVIPMIIKKLDILFILSAFTMWIVVGIFVSKIQIVDIAALNGILVALLIFLPLSFLIYKLDKSAFMQVRISTVVLGGLLGFFSNIMPHAIL